MIPLVGAGKGPAYRKVNKVVFDENHDYIFRNKKMVEEFVDLSLTQNQQLLVKKAKLVYDKVTGDYADKTTLYKNLTISEIQQLCRLDGTFVIKLKQS